MGTRYEFGSAAWMSTLEVEVRRALADVGADVGFTFSERYLDAPPGAASGWHVRVARGEVHFVAEPTGRADVSLTIDFAVARESMRPEADTPARVRTLQRQAAAEGRLRWAGEPSVLPAELGLVHDRMADRTVQPD